MKSSFCALCGKSSSDSVLLAGVNGYICFSCLGEIFSAIARTHGKPRGPEIAAFNPTANNRCMICDELITKGRLVAVRYPYCLCGSCLLTAFDISVNDAPEPLSVINC